MAESVLVGVDGSADSSAALRWALDHARARGWSVHVVHAWSTQPWHEELHGSGDSDGDGGDGTEAVDAAARTSDVLAGVDTTAISIDVTMELAAPGPLLVELSAAASLVVLGATGRGAAPGDPAIGGTARYVTAHAQCPAAVVSAPSSTPTAGEPADAFIPLARTGDTRPIQPVAAN